MMGRMGLKKWKNVHWFYSLPLTRLKRAAAASKVIAVPRDMFNVQLALTKVILGCKMLEQ